MGIRTRPRVGVYSTRVLQTLTDKTSFASGSAEQVGTEEAVLDDALLPTLADVTVYAMATCSVVNTTTAGYLNIYVEISLDGGATWTNGKIQIVRDGASGNANSARPVTTQHQRTGAVTGDIQARLMCFCTVGASTAFDVLEGSISMEVKAGNS
jgi:hypothetical protein